ncbi:hypothetical protein PHLGIDRAFT_129209 [Phlebiopsis gigantea 11061_1 CR5-6]|uniref:Uncharacterized protein n=1 Tax=Phlebiopsis gigantea (strain 11061_1 CR5-6) TaxID=745531 RepID=A0A0C3PGK0_PHLG1|nr:hypothetical protein PHLGIDRAFT_129209 [Phlebiopsis gigantea 11061_1 CR5-6]
MSHLTANPFQKHYEFPRPAPLLTPPDTEPEYSTHLPPLGHPSAGLGIDLDPSPSYRSSPTPDPQGSARKVSSLPYIHSGPREARERVVQRGLRWLVVVVPPKSFSQEHGHLGHTLAVGSPERLSQGILMPLHSTMSTQLVAIAREFAFPSTSGLCLYLHTTYSGTSVTPRISDESWSLLWSHLFEPRSPTLQHAQLPIGGKIELDIDLRKARWYESWIGLSRREHMDVPVSVVPSRPESLAHWRGDSRTTVLDDQTEQPEETLDILQLGRPIRGPSQRHVPRKLSLLDRIESSSVRSGSKLNPRNLSPPSPAADAQLEVNRPSALSPIIQGGSEPSSARKDIDKFVNSWRASATLAPSPMAATGQTSLDPVNMPNDVPIDDPSSEDVDVTSELNLEDFQWSVSSLGPPDYDEDLESFRSWRLPSIHLDRRNEGSVCLTPTTCTSFGPPDWDDDYRSFVSVISRLPSPDLAARMIDDCPPTPSTATSWGPPLEYPPSPSVLSYAPSVDIGQRAMSTVPLTPSTATSWGPPMSWPATPATPYHVHTPDVGQRTFELDVPPRRYPRPAPTEGAEVEPWRSVWPYNSTTEAPEGASSSPYSFVFPRRPTSPVASDGVEVEQHAIAQTAGTSSLVWPYYSTYREEVASERPVQVIEAPASRPAQPFSMVWPYFNAYRDDQSAQTREVRLADDVPSPPPSRIRKESPFKFVFPKDEQPTSASLASPAPSPSLSVHSPSWAQAWPLFGQKLPGLEQTPTPASEATTPVLKCESRYPYFTIYPPVYPHMEIYPEMPGAHGTTVAASFSPIQVSLPVVYPTIPLYRPVYPHNVYEIYPTVGNVKPVHGEQQKTRVAVPRSITTKRVRLVAAYPEIELYAPVYPYNVENMYPAKRLRSASRFDAVEVRLTPQYPSLDLYPAVYPYSLENIYPSITVTNLQRSETAIVQVKPAPAGKLLSSSSSYPNLEIYPAVYPWNLENIYPSITANHLQRSEAAIIQVKLAPAGKPPSLSYSYPNLEIYPAVYPWNLENIYPVAWSHHTASVRSSWSGVSIELSAGYPHIQLYKPVYPYNLYSIYPTLHLSGTSDLRTSLPPTQQRTKHTSPRNPVKALHHERGHHKHGSGSRSTPPPPVPPLPQNVQSLVPSSPTSHLPLARGRIGLGLSIRLPAVYPNICLYPPVYPHLELYPEVQSKARPRDAVDIRLKPSYPVLNIYPAVYPFIEPYPPVTAVHLDVTGRVEPAGVGSSSPTPPRRPKLSHAELHQRIFSAFAPRRRPKHTHAELHEMVFATMFPEGRSSPAQYVELPPAPVGPSRERSLSVSPQPMSPRKLPTPPGQAPVVAVGHVQSNLTTPPSPAPSPSPPPSVRRSRSGTVSTRPPLPTPPSAPSTPSTPPLTPSYAESPSRSIRRLPAPPTEPPTKELPAPPARPMSVRGMGLPSDPAVGRRISAMGPSSRPPPFAPLPPVPEPDAVEASALSAPALRPLPQPSPLDVSQLGIQRSGSLSAGLPSTLPLDADPELARAQSLTGRPLPRARRGSISPGGGLVAGLAKSYGAGAEEPTRPSMSNTLSQFPPPPRPIPSLPNSRPVSKLDRSKYPFA